MLIEQTADRLYAMKLNGMADAFKEQLALPDLNDLAFEERFALLVDRHWIWKENRRMNRLLKNAKLKDNACLEDIDFKTPRGLDKSVILRLAGSDWIKKAQNIIITGPTVYGGPFFLTPRPIFWSMEWGKNRLSNWRKTSDDADRLRMSAESAILPRKKKKVT